MKITRQAAAIAGSVVAVIAIGGGVGAYAVTSSGGGSSPAGTAPSVTSVVSTTSPAPTVVSTSAAPSQTVVAPSTHAAAKTHAVKKREDEVTDPTQGSDQTTPADGGDQTSSPNVLTPTLPGAPGTHTVVDDPYSSSSASPQE